MNRPTLLALGAVLALLVFSAAVSHYATRYRHAQALADATRHGAEAEHARAEALAMLALERAARIRAEFARDAAEREAERADSLQALLDAGRYPAPTPAQLAAVAGAGDVIPCGSAFVARCLFVDGEVLPATRAALDTLRVAYDAQSEHLSIVVERAGLLLVEAEARAAEAEALRRAIRTEPRGWRAQVELVGTAAHPPAGIELRAGVGVRIEHDRFRLSPAVELSHSGHVVPSVRLAYALTP